MIKKFLSKKIQARKKKVEHQSKGFFFVHIPKTAGTSFKNALAESTNLYRDYGQRSPETHRDIQELYSTNDFYRFKSQFIDGDSICGHVAVMKYADLVDIEHIITFVRRPVAQVVSHYNHFSGRYGYKGQFENFFRDPKFSNLQTKYLANIPLGLVGFVGVTEHYDTSILMASEHLKLSIVSKRHNINEDKIIDCNDLSPSKVSEIKSYNASDEALYQEALELFSQRHSLTKQGKKWTYLHGHINANFALHGCAFSVDSIQPVVVDVLVNGVLYQTLEANQFYNAFSKFKFPRDRYVGFHLKLNHVLSNGVNEVVLRVVSTGQSRKIIINKP
ncbi:hypothetical protein A134_00755 [Vibrio crassostreae 9CS106]|nr:hypothetical protein A134_00755 [Vibrio crassostreae 9CS106]